ncbi:MAG: efflux RND transporter periplasmic adaptor subunit [Muribaculaceae bacterium]|nr:efflux RND transporter periplasmic adaptor subunit [Muribaculaceae bacterium]
MNKIITLITVSVPLFFFTGCGSKATDNQNDKPVNVYTTNPVSNGLMETRVYTSAVEEGKSVNLGFKIGGQIKRLTVKEGDVVRKGQIIGYLDDTDYSLQVQQLEAQYNQMTSEMKRLDEMFQRNNIAPNDYEKARAGFEQLRASLELTRNQVKYARLEAPTSGYIVERYMEEGEMTGAGTPIYKIVDNSGLETSVAIPSSIYGKRGDLAFCTGNSPVIGENDFPLDVINFVPDADNNSLFRLRLKIPASMQGKLLPGMNITVNLNFNKTDNDNSFTIPSRSIFERNGKEYVWVVNDSTLSAQEIQRVGSHHGKNSTVTGLKGNESIVAVGVHHLSDGEKVKVVGDINSIEK